jgi:threonine dehydratase
MGENWNISLFHYRNHGAAYGRVLMGFQVKEEEREKFQNFINKLGIPYWDESGNPAYKKFLS